MVVNVAILDVGQGDTVVVYSEGQTREAIIIDCVDPIKVRDFLRARNIEIIRAVIVTHLHADHYSGVRTFLAEEPRWFPSSKSVLMFRPLPEGRYCKQVFSPGSESGTLYRQLIVWAEQSARVVGCSPVPNPFGGTPWEHHLEILQPNDAEWAMLLAGDFNDTSLIIRVSGEKSSLLLTGDAQVAGMRMCIKKAKEKVKADFLKVPHHGAWSAKGGQSVSFTEVIDAVKPTAAIISVGTHQRGYGHPTDEVLQTLHGRQITTLCTQATTKCIHCSVPSTDAVPCAGDILINLSLEPDRAIVAPTGASHELSISALAKGGHKCWHPRLSQGQQVGKP